MLMTFLSGNCPARPDSYEKQVGDEKRTARTAEGRKDSRHLVSGSDVPPSLLGTPPDAGALGPAPCPTDLRRHLCAVTAEKAQGRQELAGRHPAPRNCVHVTMTANP